MLKINYDAGSYNYVRIHRSSRTVCYFSNYFSTGISYPDKYNVNTYFAQEIRNKIDRDHL